MKLSDKINLFVERRSYTKNGVEKVFTKLSTGISTKQEDGQYIRFTLEVKLNAKKYPEEMVSKLDQNMVYTADLKDAWLACDTYTSKTGVTTKKLVIFVNEMELVDAKPIDQEKRAKALESLKKGKEPKNPALPW